MNTLEPAREDEIKLCYKIIEEGKRYQQEQGFTQWTDDYPNEETIRQDILDKKGFVVKVDGDIAGYMCIDFDGEPAYKAIDGKWQSEDRYAVVHRMAFSKKYRGIGLADITWRLIEEFCCESGIYYIRVDTDFPNKRMQHILEKNGYTHCGEIVFQGSGKLAYDKVFKEIRK